MYRPLTYVWLFIRISHYNLYAVVSYPKIILLICSLIESNLRRIIIKTKASPINSRCDFCVMGWMMGLEPTNAGTTNRCVNHFATPTIKFVILVRLERFEPPTTCLEGRCSIQLSYRRSSRITIVNPGYHFNRGRLEKSWSGQRDLNPRPPAPKAGALAKLRYAPIGDLISIAHLCLFVKKKK